MSNMIIAIALWCGNVNPVWSKTDTNNRAINECRKELFQCVTKDPNGNGFIKCFKDKEIGE